MKRETVRNGIVFCNRKSEVDIVAKSLKTHGFDALPIHGDLDQSTRTKTLDAFRKGELTFLVASDVAARGLDIPDVSHVFNYDVPHHADDYVHRIGRTGRAGKSGETFMIVTPADGRSLEKVLKLTKSEPDEVKLDLDWGSLKTEGGRSSGRGERSGRGGRPERGGRGRDRAERPERAERAERAEAPEATPVGVLAAEPIEANAEAIEAPGGDEAPHERSRRRRGGRGRTRDKTDGAETAPQAAPVEAPEPRAAERPAARAPEPRAAGPRGERKDAPKPPRGSDRYGSRERDDEPSRGFGSDAPAFLLRAAPVKKNP
jgi:superfamily II DNA/RNA helicase